MGRRSKILAQAEWPPTLRHVVRAVEREGPRGHAEALAALTNLALRQVPARGVFDPGARGDHELFAAIEAVARRHLELGDARSAWNAALDQAGLEFERRDAIAGAAGRVQSVSDTAHFYAGLAFGLTAPWIYRSL